MKCMLKNAMFKRCGFKSLINICIKLFKLLPKRQTFYKTGKIDLVLIVEKYL